MLMSNSEGSSALKERPARRDRRRLLKTKTPGVYRRVDGEEKTVGYVAVIEVGGRQRKKSARTYDEARRLKRGSESDRDRGLLQPNTAITFFATSTSGSSGTAAGGAASARTPERNTGA